MSGERPGQCGGFREPEPVCEYTNPSDTEVSIWTDTFADRIAHAADYGNNRALGVSSLELDEFLSAAQHPVGYVEEGETDLSDDLTDPGLWGGLR